MQKIIWIDLDDVLAETLNQVLEDNSYILWWKVVSREDILHYHLSNNKHLDISYEQSKIYYYNTYLKDKDYNIKIVSWSKEKINEFKNKWYILKAITWRPEDIEEYTKKWLEKHFNWKFESIHFANTHTFTDKPQVKRNKSEICKELWIKIMVEDNLDFAVELAESWIYTYLLEKPWNKHVKIIHPNIKKVKNWEEINI